LKSALISPQGIDVIAGGIAHGTAMPKASDPEGVASVEECDPFRVRNISWLYTSGVCPTLLRWSLSAIWYNFSNSFSDLIKQSQI
jgi:hypothetical protein